MKAVDIETLDLTELREHLSAVEGQIKTREREAERDFKAEVAELARKRGVEISNIFGDMKAMKSSSGRSSVAPKYRDAGDPSQTWSGRGKPPKWMQEHLDAGRMKEDFLIK